MVDVKEEGEMESAGKAFTGRGGLEEGHDLMNGAAREKTSLSV